jgi:hypothetical protein
MSTKRVAGKSSPSPQRKQAPTHGPGHPALVASSTLYTQSMHHHTHIIFDTSPLHTHVQVPTTSDQLRRIYFDPRPAFPATPPAPIFPKTPTSLATCGRRFFDPGPHGRPIPADLSCPRHPKPPPPKVCVIEDYIPSKHTCNKLRRRRAGCLEPRPVCCRGGVSGIPLPPTAHSLSTTTNSSPSLVIPQM